MRRAELPRNYHLRVVLHNNNNWDGRAFLAGGLTKGKCAHSHVSSNLFSNLPRTFQRRWCRIVPFASGFFPNLSAGSLPDAVERVIPGYSAAGHAAERRRNRRNKDKAK